VYGPLPLIVTDEMSVVPGWSIEIVGALANVSLAVTVTVIAPARCGAVPPYVTV
jgi:hypothetical protein